jgi:hypothetical protein
MIEIDDRFKIIASMGDCLEDRRENLASRRGPFGRFYSGKEAPKPRWAEIAMDAA